MQSQSSQQSLFAQISTPSPGIIIAKIAGPSIGQREVPIITEIIGNALAAPQQAPLKFLILDLSNITFMNSMGLGMCIDMRNRAAKLNAKTILMGMNDELTSLMRMVKVDRLYTIVKDNAELNKAIGK